MTKPQTSVTLPGGLVVPVPRWSVSLFGIVALIGISFGLYRYFYPVEPELVSAKQANALLRQEVAEYGMHIVEAPTAVLDSPTGALSVRAFADGCLLISRRLGEMSSTRLLIDPARFASTRRGKDRAIQGRAAGIFAPILSAKQRQPVCLNPHPGPFEQGYGEKSKEDACWIDVWRHWPDGCEHIQRFHLCSGAFETNPDGSPRVRWTRCVH